ncbi:MAG: hypothetical protein K0S41_1960 [Anaerocolumna sp.]|jgi:hypothetical protein|nr:hypothetical protein [Anaerocolumna sp.]
MDTMNYIKKQVTRALELNKKLVGLEDVITHIERAEYMLEMGDKDNDKHFYTDVIYRTNHAYEGILKEAYFALTNNEDKKITPNNIEKYLLDNKVLKERVIKLLENYRQEWRNTSTHDYRLFFNSGEAFSAILSVTSFVHILLNQINDNLYYLSEIERIEPLVTDIKKNFHVNYNSLNFIEKVKYLLKNYDGNLYKNPEDNKLSLLTESEFLNGIIAYINLLDIEMNIESEPIINRDSRLSPDLIISNKNDDKVIVELKVLKKMRNIDNYDDYINQLLLYLTNSNIKQGILFLLPRNINPDTVLEELTKAVHVGSEEYTIHIIFQKVN